MSVLPLGVKRNLRDDGEDRGNHVTGQALLQSFSQVLDRGSVVRVRRHKIGHQALVNGIVALHRDYALANTGMGSNSLSISPSSMRKPWIFTWKSLRPRYSMLPSARHGPGRRCGTCAHPAPR